MEEGAAAGRGRRIGSIVLVAVGALVLVLGGVLFYAREEIFDSEAFAHRAAQALEHEEVTAALADAVVDELIARGEPDLINARPLLTTATETVLGSAPFRGIFREAAERSHHTLFNRERDNLVLNLADATSLVIQAAETFSPKIADQIPRNLAPKLNDIVESDSTLDLVQFAEKIRLLGVVFPFLGLILIGAGVAVAPDRRRGFVRAAVAVAIAAGAFALVSAAVPQIVAANVGPELEDAAKAVYDAFFGDLQKALFVAVIVALVFGAAATTRRRVDAGDSVRRLGAALGRMGETRRGQALRGLLAIVIGSFLLLSTAFALTALGLLAGAYALFYGLSELLLLVAPPPEKEKKAKEGASSRASWVRLVIVVGALLGLMALFLLRPQDENKRHTRALTAIERCNGFAELCDRQLNEVSFAGVHNAMSAADDDYLMANNQKDIRKQLGAGARALLIDAHWGIPGKGPFVATDFEAEGGEGVALQRAIESTSKEFVETAQRLSQRLATNVNEDRDPEVYFCHVFCELGSTPGVTLLEWVKKFIQSHPDEVVLLFIEDYVPPAAIADIFERSGLINYVYTQVPGQPLPTLREMIASDRRVFVMAEQNGGGEKYPWYAQGFDLVQETPYTFHTAEALAAKDSCEPNRGVEDAPLFQLNHWVEAMPRSPKTAGRVNARDFLLERAQRCQAERDLLPNIVGVDFWEHGDLLDVVETLNGLPPDAEPVYADDD